MTTINLYQDNQEAPKKFSINSNKSLILSASILLVTILVFLSIKYAINPILKNRNKTLTENIKKEEESITGMNNLELVYDFQSRLEKIRQNLQIKDNNTISRPEMKSILMNLEQDMLGSVYLTSYAYENGKVSVAFVADNMDDAARQILNFRNSKNFNNISISGFGKTDKNINCNINMNIN
jgi:hypothetical protein